MRFYNQNEGKIKIDDFDVSKVDLYSLRNQIGIVSQESLLFDGTIFQISQLQNLMLLLKKLLKHQNYH